MKRDTHPPYGPVVFRDRSTGTLTLTRSTLVARVGGEGGATVEVDGTTYPVVDVDVTSDSHPFWTGTARTLDNEGRVEKFNRRYGAR